MHKLLDIGLDRTCKSCPRVSGNLSYKCFVKDSNCILLSLFQNNRNNANTKHINLGHTSVNPSYEPRFPVNFTQVIEFVTKGNLPSVFVSHSTISFSIIIYWIRWSRGNGRNTRPSLYTSFKAHTEIMTGDSRIMVSKLGNGEFILLCLSHTVPLKQYYVQI